ncbi:hypothetical protein NS220_04065 [Microbacterium testaceum]|uniref:Uncharacterized protein n=1 Tax=Microbacterium testaceum TaxID=2033 RepID=A0A147EZZ7_MICTE|nr:hypothetical protein [Microbacterium testaceum]KTR95926.1 hypothetical protein NS220_04065 [Microbacterium testaceum]
MKHPLTVLALTAGMLILCGCAAAAPTYEEVRAEADEVLQEVADLVPEPKEVIPTEGIEPYSCKDELIFGKGKGKFYTGQWAVFVDESFDIPSFIAQVPDALGAGWSEQTLGVPVSFAQVYLVRDFPRMTLTVRELTIEGRKAIDLLAISRCGTIPETPAP